MYGGVWGVGEGVEVLLADSSASMFQTTRWSLVLRAQGRGADLEQLLRQYWRPVYAWLRRQGKSREEARDLTQSFVCDVMLARDLLGRADQSRGRFRSYILSALKRYVIDEHRRSASGKRGGGVAIGSLDHLPFEVAEPPEAEDPERAFDRQWATTVLQLALERFERRCAEEGLDDQHAAFMIRVVNPAVGNAAGPSLQALARDLGLNDWTQAGSMIQTAKRRFKREIERVVLETLDDPKDLADELAAIRRALSR